MWISVPEDLVDYIKKAVVPFLDSDRVYMYTASQIVASIFTLETALKKGWSDIMRTLAEVLDKADNKQKLAAITTIGFISEALNNMPILSQDKLSNDDSEAILYCVLVGIADNQNDNEIRLQSLKSLQNSAAFVSHHIEKKSEVREKFFKDLLSCMKMKNAEVQLAGVQVFIDMIKFVYPFLDRDIREIADLSNSAIKMGLHNKEITIAYSELWSTIASEEQSRRQSDGIGDSGQSMGYIIKYYAQIVPNIMLNLKIIEGTSQVDNNIQNASQSALQNIFEVLGDESIGIVMQFLDLTFNEQTQESKIAGLMAYACCIRNISKPQAFNMLMNSFKSIVKNLEDEKPRVVEATIALLRDVAEYHHEVLISDELIKSYYKGFLEMIEGTDLPIAAGVISIFEKLAEKLSFDEVHRIEHLPDFFEQLSITLLNLSTAERKSIQDYSLAIDSVFKTMVPLTTNCLDKNQILNLLPKFKTGIEFALETHGERRILLSEGLLMSSGIGIQKVKTFKMNVNQDLLLSLNHLAVRVMNTAKGILPEAIFCMSTVAAFLMKQYLPHLDEFCRYCVEGLKNSKNAEVISSVLDCVSGLCRECPHLINKNFIENDIAPYILARMEAPELSVEQKMSLFTNLGDISLGEPEVMIRKFNEIIIKYHEAFYAILEMMQQKDDSREIAILMRDKIIQSHICVAHSIYEMGSIQYPQVYELVEKDLQIVCEFALTCIQPHMNPSIDFVFNCLSLVSDIVVIQPDKLKPISRKYDFRSIVSKLKSLPHAAERWGELLDYIDSSLFKDY